VSGAIRMLPLYAFMTWNQTALLSPAKREAGAPATLSRLEVGTMKLQDGKT